MRKNVILPYKLLNNVSLGASFVSDSVNIQYQDNIGIMIVATTNSNTGLFTIECSIDGTTWDTLTLSPAIPALAGANTTFTISLNQVPFSLIRIKFTLGTGTNGTCNAFITSKAI